MWDVNTIVTMISSVGFPIACCVYLIYTKKESDKLNADTIEKLRTTVDNNTKAMIKLCMKMGVNTDD